MVHRSDRLWIWRLNKEQLVEKLEALGLDSTGETPFLKLHLLDAARHASAEQSIFFQEWKEKFKEEQDELTLNQWAFTMPSKECKDLLRVNNLDQTGSEVKIRRTLTDFLSQTKDEEREDYVSLAEDFLQAEKTLKREETHMSSTHKSPRNPTSSENEDVHSVNENGSCPEVGNTFLRFKIPSRGNQIFKTS